jgi:hypothetical protein
LSQQRKNILRRRRGVVAASKLEPHTQTSRRTCPGLGL